MRIDDIAIHADDGDRSFREIGAIKAQVGAATIFSKTPTIEDANHKLREAALKLGANGVIRVSYDRGVTMRSWKGLTAHGTAVLFEDAQVKTAEARPSTAAELERLVQLRDQGGLSEEEFQAAKQKVLRE